MHNADQFIKESVSVATISQMLTREVSSGTAMHWIGGQWLDSGEHRESINPATGEVIGSYAYGGRKEAKLAVNAALRAFRETDWKDDRQLRARVLNRMGARFEAHAEHLAQLLATEVGKILPDARFETATVPYNLRFNAAPGMCLMMKTCQNKSRRLTGSC